MRERRVWTENDVKNGIYYTMKYHGISRMPTHAEMCEAFGDTSLSNKVNKTGGSRRWASELGLDSVECETTFGQMVEEIVKEKLEELGFSCQLTGTKHPYDILVNECVKIDVKAARKSKVRTSDVYSFRTAKTQQTCDIYIAACISDGIDIEKYYIIPSHVVSGNVQLCIGAGHSMYDKYIDRWDIIRTLSDVIKWIV